MRTPWRSPYEHSHPLQSLNLTKFVHLSPPVIWPEINSAPYEAHGTYIFPVAIPLSLTAASKLWSMRCWRRFDTVDEDPVGCNSGPSWDKCKYLTN
jgi:hypothetical protein